MGTLKLELAGALPLLLHDTGPRDGDSQTQYSIAGECLLTHTIDELRDYRCLETPQGWVLAVGDDNDGVDEAFLWRPQDGERIHLPPVKEPFPKQCKCVLSDKPGAAGGCAVLVLDLDDDEMWVCKIGSSGGWDNYSYTLTTFDAVDNPRPRHIARRHGVAAVGGKVYYELSGNELGVITFDQAPELVGIDVDMVDLPLTMPLASTYLVESRGDLFLVVVFFDGDNVHKIAELAVYRMDFGAPAWRKVYGIGDDRVFLLGGDRLGHSNFGASCSPPASGGGNCIYFLNHLSTGENYLHVIDMGKETEEIQRPFKHKGYPVPKRPPFWLLPTD